MTDHKLCHYYTYRRVEESYIDKEGKPVEYARTSRVGDCKPVSDIVKFKWRREVFDKRPYVNNYGSFNEKKGMKEIYWTWLLIKPGFKM